VSNNEKWLRHKHLIIGQVFSVMIRPQESFIRVNMMSLTAGVADGNLWTAPHGVCHSTDFGKTAAYGVCIRQRRRRSNAPMRAYTPLSQSRSACSAEVTAHPVCVKAQTSENGSIQCSHPTALETQQRIHECMKTTLTVSIYIDHQSRSAHSVEVTAHPLCFIAQTLECSSAQRSHPTASETQRAAHERLRTTLTITICIEHRS
jgi:hypothetical protein